MQTEKKNMRRLIEEKEKHETVFLFLSNTHQMTNIILNDGHFAEERKKTEGGR